MLLEAGPMIEAAAGSRGLADAGPRGRSANVLIEFALVAIVLYLLLAVTFDFGRALYCAQVVQQAADVAARELSRTPLPAAGTLRSALQSNPAAQQVFSEDYLVITPSMIGSLSLLDYFADKPIVNRLLAPLMITRQVNGQTWIHYPGQLVADSSRPSGYTVVIPIMTYTSGTETLVKVVPVLEEISVDPNDDPFNPSEANSPFGLSGANVPPGQRGLIAVRINYPFQAAALTAFTYDGGGPQPVQVSSSDGTYGPYAGPEGLGQQAALVRDVRPFRRVVSGQGIYRREIFQ
ncbi:MAG: pilus assembly protein [Gemmataceae bacterium]|nr:pilus assembly protein [Gemmataceae bacterium]MDW8264060.1 pilus assembly protein [Gemmataceae bacterium]